MTLPEIYQTFFFFFPPFVIKTSLPSAAPQVIEARQKESPFLLPEAVFVDSPKYASLLLHTACKCNM